MLIIGGVKFTDMLTNSAIVVQVFSCHPIFLPCVSWYKQTWRVHIDSIYTVPFANQPLLYVQQKSWIIEIIFTLSKIMCFYGQLHFGVTGLFLVVTLHFIQCDCIKVIATIESNGGIKLTKMEQEEFLLLQNVISFLSSPCFYSFNFFVFFLQS